MKRLPVLILVFVVFMAFIAGCASQKPVSQPVTTVPIPLPTIQVVTTSVIPAQLTGTWIVTRMGIQEGTAVINPTTQITVTFNPDGTLSGYGGCNNYNAPVTLTGQTTTKGQGITIGPLVSTKKNCEGYSQQETTYLQILQKAMAYNVDGNQLSITDQTGNILIYQTPASLVTPTQYPKPI
jgi:heat shock protein HslJ